MSKITKIAPALKHGIYSALTVLPGEDEAAFRKLQRDLIAELAPDGALEEDIVKTIAHLTWRKQNLATLRIAERAQNHMPSRHAYFLPPLDFELGADPAQSEEAFRAAEDEARKELGHLYRLVEIGNAATFDRLDKDLDILERLDSMIGKCIKRLLIVRGVKSVSAPCSSATQPRMPRISGPAKAA